MWPTIFWTWMKCAYKLNRWMICGMYVHHPTLHTIFRQICVCRPENIQTKVWFDGILSWVLVRIWLILIGIYLFVSWSGIELNSRSPSIQAKIYIRIELLITLFATDWHFTRFGVTVNHNFKSWKCAVRKATVFN